MEPDHGKLFIGGISWDTAEDRLKEYFSSYGEVVEAVIMRDRLTGRARGFGFVVFVDPAVAERVVMEKHMIDGRIVEAKKAVPREDHNGLNRNIGIVQGSPGLMGRTKKIFVGGLPSTITEREFKEYFDQFGIITDVVVMYDHNTQRPRGFGFITYDSEEAVDRVLYKTFHELSGKMVEVKCAVPKESSPGPNRSPLVGYNHGFGRPNTFLTSSYPQGYNRMDNRFSPIVGGRTGFPPVYGMGINIERALSPKPFGGSSDNIGYGRILSPYFGGYPNRYSTPTPIRYNQGSVRSEPPIGSSTQNVWGNNGLTSPGGSGAYFGSGSGGFGNNVASWGSSPSGSSAYGLVGGAIGRNNGGGGGVATTLSVNEPKGGHQGFYGNLYRGGSGYGEPTWQFSSNELDGPGSGSGSGSFAYGLGNPEDIVGISSEGYVENYSIANRQTNREIAA